MNKIGRSFKIFFLRGLGTLLPTLITIIIIVKLVGFVYDNFGRYIGIGLTKVIGLTFEGFGYPSEKEIENYLKDRNLSRSILSKEEYDEIVNILRERNLYRLGRSWQMALVGFFVALVFIWILGMFLASFIGRKLWHSVESAMLRIPGIKQLYPHIKQITDYIFGERRKGNFSRVVAVPYPSRGLWSVGFVTGPAIDILNDLTGEDGGAITVFIPTSPTPLTGFVVTVPRKDVVDLPFTIEQAFKFIVSGGVILPGKEPLRIESGDQDEYE